MARYEVKLYVGPTFFIKGQRFMNSICSLWKAKCLCWISNCRDFILGEKALSFLTLCKRTNFPWLYVEHLQGFEIFQSTLIFMFNYPLYSFVLRGCLQSIPSLCMESAILLQSQVVAPPIILLMHWKEPIPGCKRRQSSTKRSRVHKPPFIDTMMDCW